MDLDKLPLMKLFKQHMEYQTQRQRVLSENIANADTPRYRAKDLEPFEFRKVRRSFGNHLKVVGTHPNHVVPKSPDPDPFRTDADRKPFEVVPTDNSVSLEDQMLKLGRTGFDYKTTVELYKKQVRMVQTALGARR